MQGKDSNNFVFGVGMKNLIKNLLVVFTLIFANQTFAQFRPTSECGNIDAPIKGRYCIFRTPGSNSHDVIHFFHGSGSDEMGWLSDRGFTAYNLMHAWYKMGVEAPVVVAVSFGASWSLSDSNTGINANYYSKYVNEVLPFVEGKLGFSVKRRMAMGWSMGGGNAAQLLLRAPKLFERVALLCPAIVDIAPTDPNAVAYLRSVNGAESSKAISFVDKMSQKFPDMESWLNFSPLDLGQKLLNAQSPKTLIAIGDKDEWGFFRPTQSFAKLALDKGVDVTWLPMKNGLHCSFDTDQTANFLK